MMLFLDVFRCTPRVSLTRRFQYAGLLTFLLELRKKVEHLENLIGSKDATNCHGGA